MTYRLEEDAWTLVSVFDTLCSVLWHTAHAIATHSHHTLSIPETYDSWTVRRRWTRALSDGLQYATCCGLVSVYASRTAVSDQVGALRPLTLSHRCRPPLFILLLPSVACLPLGS